MRRDAHGYGVQPGSGEVADRTSIARWGDHGQRPGPERCSQSEGAVIEIGDAGCRRQVRDMGDQRVEPRAPLGFVERRHGGRIGGVGGQAIDRLGGQDDQAPGLQRPRRLGGLVTHLSAAARSG